MADLLSCGVLVVHFKGLLTVETLNQLRRQVLPLADKARAVVADYSRATMAMTSDEMLRMVHRQHNDEMIEMPTAVVADEATEHLFRPVALGAALLHGRRRLVTRDLAQALAWAQASRQETHAFEPG